jgi:putative IMPACT (imprinted ancient) family translation regulator
MAKKRASSPPEHGSDIFISRRIEDRSSTFIAYYSPAQSAKTLQANPALKDASHRVLAWRKASTQRTLSGEKQIFSTGSDDDGEKYAGKKLERLLTDLAVQGAVVVARWYGGVLLGPVRFTHMETVAKEAIDAWKEHAGVMPAKKVKVELESSSDEQVKAKLVKQLTARDQSIAVLRELLAEKTAKKPSETPESSAAAVQEAPSPRKTIDYSKMALSTLRQLEKARDKTLEWILKQIDDAEKSQAKATSVPDKGD